MNDSFCAAFVMMSTFVLSLYLKLLNIPGELYLLLLLSLGVGIGWKFGSVINDQAVVYTFYNGGMGSIMGMMLGIVIVNPAVCNVPIMTEEMIVANMYTLSILAASLFTLIFILLRYAFSHDN